MSDGNDWLLVSEIFESHQGEGPSAGQIAKFIRLGGCNLTCHWCDTPYTWVFTDRQRELHSGAKLYDPKRELKRLTFDEIFKRLQELRPVRSDIYPLIVITGGEPLLQMERVAKFISLFDRGLVYRRFEIETAGTLSPGYLSLLRDVKFNVSIKLASSGNPDEKRIVPSAINALTNASSQFKFVITRNYFEQDIDEVQDLVRRFSIYPDNVWLMPEGTTQLDQVSGLQRLMPTALKFGFNVTSRLHVLGYGNERGT